MKNDTQKLQAVLLHGKLLRATFTQRQVPGKTELVTLRALLESGTKLPAAVLAAWQKLKPLYVEPEHNDYAQQVLSGEIIASKFVRQAAERFLGDLEDGHKRGIFYDSEAAQNITNFFGLLRHSKGEWAGTVLQLEPWQKFITENLFGWKKSDGLRRFRTAHVEVARKNGKSTLLGGIGLYLLVADDEPGAEVYVAATKKKQARIIWQVGADMRDASPVLKETVGCVRNNLHHAKSRSKFEPLSSEENTLDGLNVSAALCDELHAWPTRGLYDVLSTATGARRQPLLFSITTAGFNKESVCWKNRDYGTKVLTEIVEDDSCFVFVACLDEGDNWENEKVWPKANPCLGVSCKIEDLRTKAKQAAEEPTALNDFQRLHLNLWTQQETRWMPMKKWDECGGIEEGEDPKTARDRWLQELKGCECYGGLDLATTEDVAAYVLVFPATSDYPKIRMLPWFFVPGDRIQQRVRTARVPYDAWVRQGFMTATEGNVIDYGYIRQRVNQTVSDYDLKIIGFDGWNAKQLTQELREQDGVKMEEFRQGFAHLNAPTKSTLRMVLAGEIAHAKNPVLRWMASNVAVTTDHNGNLKPSKEKSAEKIDGIVALIMAIGEMDANPEEGSVYERRGVITL